MDGEVEGDSSMYVVEKRVGKLGRNIFNDVLEHFQHTTSAKPARIPPVCAG